MARKTIRNKLTNDEKTKLINPDNLRLMEDFLSYLKSVQRSEGTISGYRNDLLIVFTYILDNLNNKNFAKLTKRDIVSIQNWLSGTNQNSPARVRRIKSALSSLSNYIENILDDEEEFKGFKSIIRKIESPVNQPVRDKTVITEEQLTTLLSTLTDNRKYEQACAVALAAFSGRRKSELVRFRISDFEDENIICNGALYKTSEKIRTKGAGLGKYIYCYTLAKKFKPYLKRWEQERAARGIQSEWLFVDRKNPSEPMKADTLNSWAKTFSDILGIDFYWHALRHYFTTYLSRSGLPDGVIQMLVGWASADMVTVYKDIDADEQFDMYFGEGGIKTAQKKQLSDM